MPGVVSSREAEEWRALDELPRQVVQSIAHLVRGDRGRHADQGGELLLRLDRRARESMARHEPPPQRRVTVPVDPANSFDVTLSDARPVPAVPRPPAPAPSFASL